MIELILCIPQEMGPLNTQNKLCTFALHARMSDYGNTVLFKKRNLGVFAALINSLFLSVERDSFPLH